MGKSYKIRINFTKLFRLSIVYIVFKQESYRVVENTHIPGKYSCWLLL